MEGGKPWWTVVHQELFFTTCLPLIKLCSEIAMALRCIKPLPRSEWASWGRICSRPSKPTSRHMFVWIIEMLCGKSIGVRCDFNYANLFFMDFCFFFVCFCCLWMHSILQVGVGSEPTLAHIGRSCWSCWSLLAAGPEMPRVTRVREGCAGI